jgi:hypothetical protein
MNREFSAVKFERLGTQKATDLQRVRELVMAFGWNATAY